MFANVLGGFVILFCLSCVTVCSDRFHSLNRFGARAKSEGG